MELARRRGARVTHLDEQLRRGWSTRKADEEDRWACKVCGHAFLVNAPVVEDVGGEIYHNGACAEAEAERQAEEEGYRQSVRNLDA